MTLKENEVSTSPSKLGEFTLNMGLTFLEKSNITTELNPLLANNLYIYIYTRLNPEGRHILILQFYMLSPLLPQTCKALPVFDCPRSAGEQDLICR